MTPRCKISPETLTALYESALPWWQKLALTQHTRRCEHCQVTLTSFGNLDTQLRTLAPIPTEVSLAPTSHRKFLISSSVAVAILSLGVWRFFTPEIEWADVEKAMSEVKTVHWRRTLTTTPRQPFSPDAPLLDRLVRMTDPVLQKAPEVFRADYACSTEQKRRFAVPLVPVTDPNRPYLCFDTSDDQRNHSVLTTLMLPPRTHPNTSVGLWRGRRVIAFSLHTSPWKKDTVFVDPRTRRILWRERSQTISIQTGLYSGFSETDEVLHYDAPITPEFLQKVDTRITGNLYMPSKEEWDRVLPVIKQHLARTNQTKLVAHDHWIAPMWSDNVSPQTGRRQYENEPMIITIELVNDQRLQVEKLLDGSFKVVE